MDPKLNLAPVFEIYTHIDIYPNPLENPHAETLIQNNHIHFH